MASLLYSLKNLPHCSCNSRSLLHFYSYSNISARDCPLFFLPCLPDASGPAAPFLFPLPTRPSLLRRPWGLCLRQAHFFPAASDIFRLYLLHDRSAFPFKTFFFLLSNLYLFHSLISFLF